MILFQRLLLASTLAAATFTAGCNQPDNNQADQKGQPAAQGQPPSVDAAAVARADAQISQTAWLGERLPEHTVAYLRLPSLWGAVSAPDGRALDAVLAAQEHVKIVAALRKAAQTDPLLAQATGNSIVQLLLGDQAAPIEVAVVDASDGVSPFSRGLVTTVLDVQDIAALNARIAALNTSGQSPLQAPVDASGDASLQQFGALHFDPSTHRLYLSLGTTASATTLQQDMAQLKSTHAHPMQDAEHEIDASGQGLFAWLNMKGLNNQLEASLQDQPADGVLRDAAEHMQSIALGWGTIDGRGRLQLQVRGPQTRLLGYLATNAGEVALKSSGKPDWVATMAIAGSGNLQNILNNIDRDFGAGQRSHVDAGLTRIRTSTGIDPIAFDRLLGQHLVFFADANGRFAALPVRDRKGLYAKLEELSHRFGGKLETLTDNGVEIHHWFMPGIDTAANAPADADPQARAAMQLYSRIGSHYFWVEDGDYLVFSNVPQSLVDRVASKPDTALAGWLHDKSYDSAHTLIGFASTTHNMQREVYYAYLQFLEIAGDALGQKVDLTKLPSAGQLHLPVEGASGIAVEANDQRLAVQVTYEQSPVEGIFGGGSSTTSIVAVTAILAAIAIPAYQDYVIRSQVSEGAALAEGSKTAVAEYYSNRGNMPHDNAAAGIASPTSIAGNYVSSVTIDDGKIQVAYDGAQANAALKGSILVFAPTPGSGSVAWTCNSAAGTTVNVKYRPLVCRP